MEFIVDGSADCLAEYLSAEGVHEDVVAKIIDNTITCALFLDLEEEDLKDLATMIGDRIALRNVLAKARKVLICIFLTLLQMFCCSAKIILSDQSHYSSHLWQGHKLPQPWLAVLNGMKLLAFQICIAFLHL